MWQTLAIVLVASIALSNAQSYQNDFVPQFPWWGNYSNFQAYSGMLNISNNTASMHYVFLTSQQNKSTDPVVLWLNGGPGCSSMLGLISENGPFIMENGQNNFTQTPNPYSWNLVANMLYIESPPGVGFSQNYNPNYYYNDTNTANNNWQTIVAWLQRFPQYQNRNFWITGESYAGMYIPYTAQYIIQQNAISSNPKVNLKGVMIGNGVFNISSLDANSNWFFDYQNFFGPSLSNIWETNCQSDPNGAKCTYFQKQADKILYLVDPYNVYGQCYGGFDLVSKFHPKYARLAQEEKMRPRNSGGVGDGGAPCADFAPYQNYFNTPYVQQALHVPNNSTWEACSDIDYNIAPAGSFPCYLNTLFKTSGLQILIYSGDIDGVVPYTDTVSNLDILNTKAGGKRIVDWHQWKVPSTQQVGGQAMQYTNFNFTTIRAAGHMVPTDQPAAGFYMFNQTLNGQSL